MTKQTGRAYRSFWKSIRPSDDRPNKSCELILHVELRIQFRPAAADHRQTYSEGSSYCKAKLSRARSHIGLRDRTFQGHWTFGPDCSSPARLLIRLISVSQRTVLCTEQARPLCQKCARIRCFSCHWG